MDDFYDPSDCRVFVVPKFNINDIDFSRPPANGDEYLQRVIHEAKTGEACVVPLSTIEKWRIVSQEKSSLMSPYFVESEPPATETCLQKYLATRKVQDFIIADFSRIRLAVSNYKQKYADNAKWLQSIPKQPQQKEDWLLFLFGKPEVKTSDLEEDYFTGRPQLKVVVAMSQPTIWNLLEYHNKWLEDGVVDVVRCAPWIYALLTNLEIPLYGDILHVLRELARYLIAMLDTANVHNEEVYCINVIIILIARYFRQFDLIESYRRN